MNKDEMKCKISMALKDPILQQGFEIICKQIAELKEKNKSYEEIIDNSSTTLARERSKNYKQLTEAKEIIKGLLESCFGYHSKSVNYEVKARAEKFLEV